MKVSMRLQRSILRGIFAALATLACAPLAQAADYYVAMPANGGSDSNPGTSVAPFATIGAAITAADAAIVGGDTSATIHVATGTYSESGLLITNAITIVGATSNPADVMISKNAAILVKLSHADAVLRDLTVMTGKSATMNGDSGMVVVTAGLVDHCILRNATSDTNKQGQGLCMSGGRITRSVIRNNGTYGEPQKSSAIWMKDAKMDNCLIMNHNNTLNSNCGAVRSESGNTIVNCTFANNKPLGIISNWGTAPTLINCVFFVSTGRTSGTANAEVGGTDANEWPSYFDSNETYRPIASCTTIVNSGSDDAYPDWASTTDLDGNPRKSGSAIDVGCYEFDLSSASVVGEADSYGIKIGTTSTFTASALGGSGNYTFKWNFGDGSMEETTASATITHTYAAAGLYAATVAVSDDSGASWSAPEAISAKVLVAPADLYVNASNASPAFPYDTAEKAATTFAAAYGCLTNTVVATLGMAVVDGVTIHVADGTYAERGFTLKGAIRVIGSSGTRGNVLVGTSGGRVFYLDNADATLDSITIQNGDSAYGANVYVNNGTVNNCVVTNGCSPTTNAAGTGAGNLQLVNGLVADCEIVDARCGVGNVKCQTGPNIYMTGGSVQRCVIRGCKKQNPTGYAEGAALAATAGVAENCLMTGIDETKIAHSGGTSSCVYLNGTAKLVNCTVTSNKTTRGAVVIASDNAKAVNCVVFGNGVTGAATWGNARANCFTNCAFSADAAYSGTASTVLNLTDVAFKDYANGDYRPAKGGALVNAGTKWADYLSFGATSETDLAGAARLSGKFLDIGCYEAASGVGLSIIVR